MVPLEHDVQGLHEASVCDVESCHVDVAVQGGHVRSAVVVHATIFVPAPQVVEQSVQEVAVLDDCLYVDSATQLIQVCAPAVGVAESRYPALQALQSIVEVVPHNVPADPVATVSVPPGQAHVLAVQDLLFK